MKITLIIETGETLDGGSPLEVIEMALEEIRSTLMHDRQSPIHTSYYTPRQGRNKAVINYKVEDKDL